MNTVSQNFPKIPRRQNLIVLCLMSIILCLTTACNDDNDGPANPLEQLPPMTATGENTFGALLDGAPFIPSGGTNPLDCQYQLINGERYFQLQGRKRNENFNLISLSLLLLRKLREVRRIN